MENSHLWVGCHNHLPQEMVDFLELGRLQIPCFLVTDPGVPVNLPLLFGHHYNLILR